MQYRNIGSVNRPGTAKSLSSATHFEHADSITTLKSCNLPVCRIITSSKKNTYTTLKVWLMQASVHLTIEQQRGHWNWCCWNVHHTTQYTATWTSFGSRDTTTHSISSQSDIMGQRMEEGLEMSRFPVEDEVQGLSSRQESWPKFGNLTWNFTHLRTTEHIQVEEYDTHFSSQF